MVLTLNPIVSRYLIDRAITNFSVHIFNNHYLTYFLIPSELKKYTAVSG